MKKFNIERHTNNFLKEYYILKLYTENGKFILNFVGNKKEIIKFISKNLKVLLSENILLSEIFLSDLIEIKMNNKEFIYL